MKYLALIGDIVDSKELPRRAEFQTRLEHCLKSVNARNAALASPFTITLGDEFQAVYKSADPLFANLFSIMAAIHPVHARFAIGVGKLTTRINPKQALGMDGPAFHRAREGITELKRTDFLLRIEAGPGGVAPWKLVNHLLNFTSPKIAGWEKNRLRIVHGLLTGVSVAELERTLAISNVAVYKNINAAALDEWRGICEEITRALNHELKTP